MLSSYLQKFKLRPEFNCDDFEHWFLPRPDIIDTFVVEKDGKITGIINYSHNNSRFKKLCLNCFDIFRYDKLLHLAIHCSQ